MQPENRFSLCLAICDAVGSLKKQPMFNALILKHDVNNTNTNTNTFSGCLRIHQPIHSPRSTRNRPRKRFNNRIEQRIFGFKRGFVHNQAAGYIGDVFNGF